MSCTSFICWVPTYLPTYLPTNHYIQDKEDKLATRYDEDTPMKSIKLVVLGILEIKNLKEHFQMHNIFKKFAFKQKFTNDLQPNKY